MPHRYMHRTPFIPEQAVYDRLDLARVGVMSIVDVDVLEVWDLMDCWGKQIACSDQLYIVNVKTRIVEAESCLPILK